MIGKVEFGTALFLLCGIAQADSPSTELDRLATVLPGTWKSQGQTFDSAFTKAGPQNYTTVRDCWRESDTYKCVFVVNGSLQLLDIFSWNASDRFYSETQITAQGKQPEFRVTVKDNTWTYDQDIANRDGHVIHYRITRTYDSPVHATYSYAYSEDRKQWTEIARGIEQRLDLAR